MINKDKKLLFWGVRQLLGKQKWSETWRRKNDIQKIKILYKIRLIQSRWAKANDSFQKMQIPFEFKTG